MADAPATPNPVNPLAAIGGFVVRKVADVTLATIAPVPIANPDPSRISLLAVGASASTDWGISPEPEPSGFGIRGIAGTNWILIHSASFPALTQGAWWVSGQTFPLRVVVYTIALSPLVG